MPITTHSEEAERYGGDAQHWHHVLETIFVPAIEQAGFQAIRPKASGSDMIHGQIIKHLYEADMVLCDLSGHNPNVFFELGVRTSLNLPVALVRDEHTSLPFDTSGLNTHAYASSLNGWDTVTEVARLTQHLRDSVTSCNGGNPMWRHFGLKIAAEGPSDMPSSADAQMTLMFEGMSELRAEMQQVRRSILPDPLSPENFADEPHLRARSLSLLAAELGIRLEKPFRLGRMVGPGKYDLIFESSTDLSDAPDVEGAVEHYLRTHGWRVETIDFEGDALRLRIDRR